MVHCSYKALLGKVTPSQGTPCGKSTDYPGQLECIAFKDCTKDVTGHLKTLNLSADEGLGSEINPHSKLLVLRAGTICKQCNEYISKQAMPNQTLVFASGGVEPVPGVSHLQELPEPHLLVEGETGRSSAETTSSELSSDDLATELKRLEISSRGRDDETFLSPDTGSLVSSTSDEAPTTMQEPRKKLNEYLVSKNIPPITQPWMEWDKAGESTKKRYTKRTVEIFSSVLQDLTPNYAGSLWQAVVSSPAMNKALKLDELSQTSKNYLQALAEAYGKAQGPHLVQDLPFGQKTLKLSSGHLVEIPNVIRTMIPQRITRQYAQYCHETGFKPFSECTMLRVLEECKASVRKSLQGLDYVAADGARAFEDLDNLVRRLGELGLGKEWELQYVELLKGSKLYLKIHVCSSSEIAIHCSVFALSDSTSPDLQQQCSHKHEECCEQCEILHSTLQNISSAVERASFATQDDKEEALFLVNASVLAIQS
ncbi:unnamed protein product [Porites lobata]|uniref:Vitellogenin n=1 Tax=Porites lobata TaxID=104759 RepID=A0ABN8PQP5_9CNID|nr:unnamed protein product [Porites lobata]